MCLFAQLLVGGIFTSCNKENLSEKNKETPTISAEDYAAAMEIETFYANMTSTKKSGENYTVNEAMQLMENTINYYYCYGFEENAIVEVAIDTIALPANTANLHSNDAATIFNNILNTLGMQLDNMGRNNANLALANLEIIEEEGINYIEVNGSFNKNETLKSANNGEEINPDDWWYSFLEWGKCGAYSGYEGLDASYLIKDETNAVIENHLGGRQYWSNVGEENFNAFEYPETNNPNYTHRILTEQVYYTYPDYNKCLSPNDIQYYTDNLIEIAQDFPIPEGKIIINMNRIIQYHFINAIWWYYKPEMYYGIKRTRLPNYEEAEDAIFSLP